jgi:hypothetical protein
MTDSCCSNIVVVNETTSVIVAGGEQGPPGVSAPITFETYSKNLKAIDYSFIFDSSGNLDHINYSNGVVKTFTRNIAGAITSITLSGVVPPEVSHTTKNFTYDSAGVLVSISYS